MTVAVVGLAVIAVLFATLSKPAKALDNGVGKLPCE
jgi:hypothetical protein